MPLYLPPMQEGLEREGQRWMLAVQVPAGILKPLPGWCCDRRRHGSGKFGLQEMDRGGRWVSSTRSGSSVS